MSKAKVICFGGGYDLGFLSALGNEGIRLIREYVHSGGNYLGMCAGAYFACNYIEFDKDGPLEVVGNRDLRFYPGKQSFNGRLVLLVQSPVRSYLILKNQLLTDCAALSSALRELC